MNIAFIVFGGVGSRLNSSIPKQFIKIKRIDLVVYTIKQFESSPLIDEIVLVTNKDYFKYTKKLVKNYSLNKVSKVVVGGATRQESIRNAFKETNYSSVDSVLIHDGDRPLVDHSIIKDNIEALKSYNIACTAIRHSDALESISNSGRKKEIDGVLYDIQTPQTFRYGMIKKAHLENENDVPDDISLLEKQYDVFYVKGSPLNFKVTKDIDLEYLKTIL